MNNTFQKRNLERSNYLENTWGTQTNMTQWNGAWFSTQTIRTTAGGLTTKRWQKTWWATNKKHQSSKKRKQISPSKFVSRSKLQNRISVNMFNQFIVSKMERMGKYLEKLLKWSILLPRFKKKKFYKLIWIPDLLCLYRWPQKKWRGTLEYIP